MSLNMGGDIGSALAGMWDIVLAIPLNCCLNMGADRSGQVKPLK